MPVTYSPPLEMSSSTAKSQKLNKIIQYLCTIVSINDNNSSNETYDHLIIIRVQLTSFHLKT